MIDEAPSPSWRQRIISKLLYVCLLIIIVIGGVFLFWAFEDSPVLEVKNAPFPVRPPVQYPDLAEVMTVDYCKVFNAKGKVSAKLVGKQSIIEIPFPDEKSEIGCVKSDVPIVVPSYALDDTYYFSFTIRYQLNPIKTKTVHIRSQPFEVHHQ